MDRVWIIVGRIRSREPGSSLHVAFSGSMGLASPMEARKQLHGRGHSRVRGISIRGDSMDLAVQPNLRTVRCFPWQFRPGSSGGKQ